MLYGWSYIGIWMNSRWGGGGSIPATAILDYASNPILDAQGNYILQAQ